MSKLFHIIASVKSSCPLWIIIFTFILDFCFFMLDISISQPSAYWLNNICFLLELAIALAIISASFFVYCSLSSSILPSIRFRISFFSTGISGWQIVMKSFWIWFISFVILFTLLLLVIYIEAFILAQL